MLVVLLFFTIAEWLRQSVSNGYEGSVPDDEFTLVIATVAQTLPLQTQPFAADAISETS